MTVTKFSTSTGGIVMNGSRVLVVQQKAGTWSLPKGHVEPGESELETARREIYEESGVNELEYIRKLGSYQRHPLGKDGEVTTTLKTIVLFLFTTTQEHLQPIDPENPEARWIEKEHVADILSHPRDKEFFRTFLSGSTEEL